MKKVFLVVIVLVLGITSSFVFPLSVSALTNSEKRDASCSARESLVFEKEFFVTMDKLVAYISSDPSRGDGYISADDLDFWQLKSQELYFDYAELEVKADILCPEAVAMWQAGNKYIEVGFKFCADRYGDPTVNMPFSEDQMKEFKRIEDTWLRSKMDFVAATAT